MSPRVFSVVYKEIRGLHHAAYILALFTFLSQVLALVRDRLLAHEFGAGFELDLYYAAFRIPDMLYVLFASSLSAYILIPLVSEKRSRGGDKVAQAFLSNLFTVFCLVYALVAVLIAVYTPEIVRWLFPGIEIYTDTFVLLIRLLLLQPFLLGVSSLFGVITQLEQRFVLFAVSPLIYNIGIIIGIVTLYPFFGLVGIVYGVLIGALGHVLVQIPFLIRNPIRPHFSLPIAWRDVTSVVRASYIRVITLSLHQIVLLAFVAIASSMTVGSVAVFQLAYNLQSVPLAIIGVSYSVAAFPLLARLSVKKEYETLRTTITSALRHIIFWSVPTLVLFIVLRAQFVRIVFGTGAFDWDDTRLTAALLAVFIISLTAQALHIFLIRAFYAAGNTRIPLFATLFTSILALLSAYGAYLYIVSNPPIAHMFASLLHIASVPGIEVIALPLGYSLALIAQALILLYFARTSFSLSIRALILPSCTALASAFLAGGTTYGMLHALAPLFSQDTFIGIFLQGSTAGICGVGVYCAGQYIFKNGEILEIMKTARRRYEERTLIAPQPEDV